jgi:hypothetical protein
MTVSALVGDRVIFSSASTAASVESVAGEEQFKPRRSRYPTHWIIYLDPQRQCCWDERTGQFYDGNVNSLTIIHLIFNRFPI